MSALRVNVCRRSWKAIAIGVVTAGVLAGVGGAEARQMPRAVSSDPLVTVAVSPYRVLDTRLGTGVDSPAPLGPGGSIDVQIAGVGPVPSNAVGVVLNLTATQVTDAGYVTAWPTGEERPTTSVLNLTPGQDIPNMVTVLLGGGKLSLFNFTGSVHLLGDVAAYLIPGTGAGTVGPQGPPGPKGASGIAPQQTMIFSGYDMVGIDESLHYLNARGCAETTTTSTVGMLPLDLPVGALPTAVRVGYEDRTPSGRQRHTVFRVVSPSLEFLQGPAKGSSHGNTVVGTFTLDIGTPVPVAADSTYYVYSELDHEQRVCRVEVDYTMPAVG